MLNNTCVRNHVLSKAQDYALCKWIETNKEMLLRERPRLRVAAAQAVAELGFLVTVSNLTSARDAVGINWSKPAPKAQSDIKVLASALMDLAGRVSVTVSDDVARLAGRLL